MATGVGEAVGALINTSRLDSDSPTGTPDTIGWTTIPPATIRSPTSSLIIKG